MSSFWYFPLGSFSIAGPGLRSGRCPLGLALGVSWGSVLGRALLALRLPRHPACVMLRCNMSFLGPFPGPSRHGDRLMSVVTAMPLQLYSSCSILTVRWGATTCRAPLATAPQRPIYLLTCTNVGIRVSEERLTLRSRNSDIFGARGKYHASGGADPAAAPRSCGG